LVNGKQELVKDLGKREELESNEIFLGDLETNGKV